MAQSIRRSTIEAVCKYFRLTEDQLCGPLQTHAIAHPRQLAMAVMRDLSGGRLSLPEIGRMFDNRDHSTVKFALDRVQKRRKESGFWDAAYKEIRKQVRDDTYVPVFRRGMGRVVFKTRRDTSRPMRVPA